MNAFTSSDHTTYPFATTNPQDFQNLMSVYLDATLRPLLNADDFAQEGWRIGPENSSLPGSSQENNPLVFKGVVYNEMKGQMSDAGYLYYSRWMQHFFPSINNSGGDPQKITDLTHQALKGFHASHYHPSNARMLTYGNMPLEGHLKEVAKVLQRFKSVARDEDIKVPVDLSSGPVEVSTSGPAQANFPLEKQYKTSTSWITCPTSDIVETFSLSMVAALLTDGYGSPMYRALIESGLGADYAPNTGFDPSGKLATFSLGLSGVAKDDVPRVKEVIERTFTEMLFKGFEEEKVNGILHQLEMGIKHKSAHFGMSMMNRVIPGWHNGVDPFDTLGVNDIISSFKERYKTEGYLEDLMQKYLMTDRSLTFTMEPSTSFGANLAEEEMSRLSGKIQEISEELGSSEQAYVRLSQRETELAEMQENARKQDLSCLPTVHVQDIQRQMEKKQVRDAEVGSVSVQWREAPTNGLTYFRAIHEFRDLSNDLRDIMPLFSACLLRLGTKDKTIEQLEDLIQLKTGGLSFDYYSATSAKDTKKFSEGFQLSGSAFDGNVPDMYGLISTIIKDTDFDQEGAKDKIKQLIQASAQTSTDDIAQSGNMFAAKYAAAQHSAEAQLNEQVSGLSQVFRTVTMAKALETEKGDELLEDLVTRLKLIQKVVISDSSKLRVSLTCGPEAVRSNDNHLRDFLARLPKNASFAHVITNAPLPAYSPKTFMNLPFQVYYSGLVIPTVPFVHEDHAKLSVLAQLLTHKHLHHEIREKGGAYGASASLSNTRGVILLHTYRDPNPQNSIEVMLATGKWAAEREWTDRDLEEAKLSVFQRLDAPQSVSEEGLDRFLFGIDDDMWQQKRERILDVTAREVNEVAQKYLVDGAEKASLCVLGEKKEWVDEKQGWQIDDGLTKGPEENKSGRGWLMGLLLAMMLPF